MGSRWGSESRSKHYRRMTMGWGKRFSALLQRPQPPVITLATIPICGGIVVSVASDNPTLSLLPIKWGGGGDGSIAQRKALPSAEALGLVSAGTSVQHAEIEHRPCFRLVHSKAHTAEVGRKRDKSGSGLQLGQ